MANVSSLMELPDHLLEEILSRLPLKNLCTARAVCKLWKDLSSTENFKKLLQQNSPRISTPVVEVVAPWRQSWSFFSVDEQGKGFPFCLHFLGERMRVRASSGGLLCCSKLRVRYATYVVCNPITRMFRVLPNSIANPMDRPHFLAIGKEAELGLVCDPSSQSYRVVVVSLCRHVTLHGHKDAFVWYTFDSNTNDWTIRVSSSVQTFQLAGTAPGVFADGCLYWLEGEGRFLLIDLNVNAAKLVYSPGHLRQKHIGDLSLLELNDHLAVIQTDNKLLSVWTMKPSEEGIWRVLYRVSLGQLRAAASPRPISISGDYIFVLNDDQVWMWDRKIKGWSMIYCRKDWSCSWNSVFSFCGSLSAP